MTTTILTTGLLVVLVLALSAHGLLRIVDKRIELIHQRLTDQHNFMIGQSESLRRLADNTADFINQSREEDASLGEWQCQMTEHFSGAVSLLKAHKERIDSLYARLN